MPKMLLKIQLSAIPQLPTPAAPAPYVYKKVTLIVFNRSIPERIQGTLNDCYCTNQKREVKIRNDAFIRGTEWSNTSVQSVMPKPMADTAPDSKHCERSFVGVRDLFSWTPENVFRVKR